MWMWAQFPPSWPNESVCPSTATIEEKMKKMKNNFHHRGPYIIATQNLGHHCGQLLGFFLRQWFLFCLWGWR